MAGRPPVLHLMSHRGCAPDASDKLKNKMKGELDSLRAMADKIPSISRAKRLFDYLPAELLRDPKWARHLKDSRGRGWWFWKAALVNLLLQNGTIAEGDAVLWADGDLRAGHLGTAEQWEKALQVTWSPQGLDFIIAAQPACELQWTKGDAFKKFNTTWDDPQYGLQAQPQANLWLMKVNPKTRRLMQLFEDLMADYQLVNDDPSSAPNSPVFKAHRNDQSVLSLLLKASKVFTGHCSKYPMPPDWQPKLHPLYGIEGLRAKQGRWGASLPSCVLMPEKPYKLGR